MSRSRKRPIIKYLENKRDYWRTVRRVFKQKVHNIDENNVEDIILPKKEEIVNDYFYCDSWVNYEDGWAGEDMKEKMSRK
jgi:hypothetical protein